MPTYRIVKETELNGSIHYSIEERILFFWWLYVDGSLSLSYEEAKERLKLLKDKSLPAKEVIETNL